MRTVRSAVQARNRPRATLAWALIVVLAATVALAARAAAAPASAASPDEAGALDEAGAPDDGDADADELDPDGLDPEDPEDADAPAADAPDAAERFDARLRRPRPPRWGKLELTVMWRRTLDEAPAADPSRRGALWLLATWSR